MLKQLLLLICICLSLNIYAQSPTYSRIKIFLEGHDVKELSRLGVDISEGEYRKGYSFISDFSQQEIERIQDAGFKTEVIIKDVKQYYKDQNKKKETKKTGQVNTAGCGVIAPDYAVPTHFSLGSMGGYFTYDEMLALLDSMVAQYPNLITVKQPIGANTTIEGRNIYYVKISDNPNLNEPEPQVLYTALHHAREPQGLSQLIFYMYYLLENYATDPDIQQLVQNTEMYFVPCVNPDGYIYNETTDPNGGGLWRKNRRDNMDGTFGVDLNRNYGYNWGFDDDGSSPFTSDETYRGTSAFSEPETQLLRDFVNAHQFKLAFNYHTYSNLLIYPWGFQPNIYTPDSALYDNFGQLLTRYNGYKFGTGNQTVNYITNGNSDDWMYGEQTSKPKVFAMTPEVGEGTFGFWPPSSEIIRLSKENMFANITVARLAGRYGVAEDASPSYFNSHSGYVKFNFRLLGMDTTGIYNVIIAPANAAFASAGNPGVYTNLSSLQEITDSIPYTLNASTGIGDEIKYVIIVYNGSYNIYSDTITKYFGTPSVLVNEQGNNMNNWLAGSQWGIDNTHYFSAGSSISDSPNSFYQPNITNDLILSGQVSLANALHVLLTFRARWEIETNWDYAQVLISTDNGISWNPLCGRYTRQSVFPPNLGPIYDGFHSAWVHEEINLDNYIGQNIRIKFSMNSDGFVEYDGFFIDDLQINMINTVGINNIHTNVFFIGNAMPNPASETVNIQYALRENSVSDFEVVDPLSRHKFSKTLYESSGQINLDVSTWNAGVYFYRITNKEGSSEFGKMIIE